MWLDLLCVFVSTLAVLLFLPGCTTKGKKGNNYCKSTGGPRSVKSPMALAPPPQPKPTTSVKTALPINTAAPEQPGKPSKQNTAGGATKSQKKTEASRVPSESQVKKTVGERREDATQEDGDGPNDFELKAFSEGTVLDPRLVKRLKLAAGVEKPLEISEFNSAAVPPDAARVTIDAVGFLYETDDPLVPEAYNNNEDEQDGDNEQAEK